MCFLLSFLLYISGVINFVGPLFFFFFFLNQSNNGKYSFSLPFSFPFALFYSPIFTATKHISPFKRQKELYLVFFFGFSSVTITCMLPTTASNGRLTNLKDLRIKNISIWCKYIPQNRRSIMLNSPRNVMYTWTKFIYELTKDILIYTTATNSITVITEMV